jgi:hypothetical protein
MLKLDVEGPAARDWWVRLIEKLTALPDCHATESLRATKLVLGRGAGYWS